MQRLSQKSNIDRFHRAFKLLGIDTDQLYATLEVNSDAMVKKPADISMALYFSLLNEAAKQSQRPFLGMEMALEPTLSEVLSEVGVLKYLIRNSKDLGMALLAISQFVTLISPGSYVGQSVRGNDTFLSYGFKNVPSAQCKQDVEATLVQFILMIKEILNDLNWLPKAIEFTHSMDAGVSISACPLATALHYDQAESGILFPSALLLESIPGADAELYAILEQQAKVREAETGHEAATILDRVSAVILANLEYGEISAEFIAKELGLSRRSLYRRLKENGTTFVTLHSQIVASLAREQLANSSVSVTELALALGYSDVTTFIRAFKRIVGVTPLNYRKQYFSASAPKVS